jgi:Protein of unknown function (DUF3795)
MRESYCGLCEECRLGEPEFLKALVTVKEYLDGFRVNWWAHCFPGDEGFSLPEFHRGLDWFLGHAECSGCKGGKGEDRCPIRNCALRRNQGHCHECPELIECEKFAWLKEEFPDQKTQLRRRQLKYLARESRSRIR